MSDKIITALEDILIELDESGRIVAAAALATVIDILRNQEGGVPENEMERRR